MKVYKCKYCGCPIKWEKDKDGKPRAVERSIYYEPDMHGNLLVLTASGNIVRAREQQDAERAGSVLHTPRCIDVPRYSAPRGYSFPQPKRQRRRGLVINEMRTAKAAVKTAAPVPEQVSLFD